MRCLFSVDAPLSGELHLVTCGYKLRNYACTLCNTLQSLFYSYATEHVDDKHDTQQWLFSLFAIYFTLMWAIGDQKKRIVIWLTLQARAVCFCVFGGMPAFRDTSTETGDPNLLRLGGRPSLFT